jgi:F-type H+-transporting ATPase subunit epsilon
MLPENFQLEVVTPERRVIRATAVEVQVPARDGYLGILPGHAPLLGAMGNGELSYRDGQQTHYAAVFGGYIEVLGGRVIVLAEAAERAEEISAERASAAKRNAEAILAIPNTPEEEAGPSREALTRAELRVKVAGRASGIAHSAAEAVHSA